MNFFLIFFCLLSNFLFRNVQSDRVLVLGGNGFVGNGIVRHLIRQKYHVTLACRCNNYFNSDYDLIPYVNKVIKCDRNDITKAEKCYDEISQDSYEHVIDLSAFQQSHVVKLLDKIKTRIKNYILVSTVAVNDVINSYKNADSAQNKKTLPISEEALKTMNISDEQPYATNKLLCEIAAQQISNENNFTNVIIRLSDVIGLRDTSFRIWHYQLLVRLHKMLAIKVPVPKMISNKTFALTHIEHVSAALLRVMTDPKTFTNKIVTISSYNDVTLGKLISSISACLNVDDVSIETDENKAWYKYPTNGEQDIKTGQLLEDSFQPLDFHKAICEIVKFNENAMTDKKYAADRELFMAEFVEETLPDEFEDIDLFVRSVKQVYGEHVFNDIDIGLEGDEENTKSYGHAEL